MGYIWDKDTPPEICKYAVIDKHRHIHIPSHLKTIHVTGDNNAQTLMFKIERYQDGIDLSEYECVVRYVNAGNEYGECQNIEVEVQDEILLLSWKITNYTTRYHGEVKFTVQFEKENSNYQWQTTPATLLIREALPIEKAIVEKDDIGFRTVAAQVQKIEEEFGKVEEKVASYDDKIEHCETVAEEIDKKVTSYDDRIEACETSIEDLQEKVESYDDKFADYEERISNIKENVNDISDKVNDTMETVSDLKEEVQSMHTDVESMSDSINAIDTTVSNMSERIDDINDKVNDIEEKVDNLDTEISEKFEEIIFEVYNKDGSIVDSDTEVNGMVIPTKVSELENDANYYSIGNPLKSLEFQNEDKETKLNIRGRVIDSPDKDGLISGFETIESHEMTVDALTANEYIAIKGVLNSNSAILQRLITGDTNIDGILTIKNRNIEDMFIKKSGNTESINVNIDFIEPHIAAMGDPVRLLMDMLYDTCWTDKGMVMISFNDAPNLDINGTGIAVKNYELNNVYCFIELHNRQYKTDEEYDPRPQGYVRIDLHRVDGVNVLRIFSYDADYNLRHKVKMNGNYVTCEAGTSPYNDWYITAKVIH